MIDYFLIGIKSMMKSSVLTFAIYFVSFLLLLILWRRISLCVKVVETFLPHFILLREDFISIMLMFLESELYH